ncbi:MAG TPA: SDR family oxidoreductase [Moraxellaceae bacterium]|nr:SDR family oxidoreductase [Moraxellaceae bacterium]
MANVLIVGCGDVGGRLARQLADAGHEVHGLRRAPFALKGVHCLTGDVTDPVTLSLPPQLDYVFVLLAPGESGEDAYRRVYYEGTRHLLAALAGESLRRIFWVSSSSVYGQDDGSWVNETSSADPASPTACILRASEDAVRASGWPTTIVRFSGLYGSGRLRLVNWVKSGRPVQAAPVQWTNRIHVTDAAGLLAFLMAQDIAGVPLADTYIGTDSEPAPQHEVLDWIADRLQVARVPHEARPDAGSNKRLSNARLLALGYRLRFPDFRAGYADVLAQHPE